MKGDPIPDSDRVARYCRGDAVGTGAAFLLRKGEDYLSVNWLEHLKLKPRAKEIAEIRNILRRKLTVGARAQIAILNVGNTRQYVLSETPDRRDLRFSHEPDSPIDESHSGIFNTKSEDEMLIAELIAESIVESYSAR